MANALPPPQYDHKPEIPVIEHVLSAAEVNKLCISMGVLGPDAARSSGFLGCAHKTLRPMPFIGNLTTQEVVCEIWIVDNAIVRRHELAHCNGWPPDHPDK
jgi:hypothetical protein